MSLGGKPSPAMPRAISSTTVLSVPRASTRRRTNAGRPTLSPAMTPIAEMAMRPARRTIGSTLDADDVRGATPVHSSTMRCALLPPKPKLLIAARRGPSLSHGAASVRSVKP